jgi:ABC-type Fe3+ transport system permease subunit
MSERFTKLVEEKSSESEEQEQVESKKKAAKKIATAVVFVAIAILLWKLLPFLGTFFLPPFQEAWENLQTGFVPLLRSLLIYGIWFAPFILIAGLMFVYFLAKAIAEVSMSSAPKKKS